MSTYPRIVAHPDTWCAVCGKSWTQRMVAVRFVPLSPLICGECVLAAAAMVTEEQRRRVEDEAARRNT